MARKVLIADDSPTVQKKASGVLTGEGMEVVTVSNGVAAIKKLPTVLPTVILADVAMPGKDGYEVCEFVKGSKEYANVPVILIFSDNDVLDEPKSAKVRADGRIKKPFDREELIATVTKYLAIGEAAAANVVPPPVIKAPPPPTFVNEPVDEEPEIEAKDSSPDFAAFGGGMAFAEPGLEEIQATPAEPAPTIETYNPSEPPPVIEPEIHASDAPIIEVEEPAHMEPQTEAAVEMPMPTPAEPPASSEPVFIEDRAEPQHSHDHEHDHPHESAPERTMMFHAPADIAEPVLSDELAPEPTPVEAPYEPPAVEALPQTAASAADEMVAEGGPASAELEASPEAASEPSHVSASTLESFSLSEAAAGNVRFAPPEVPVEADAMPVPEEPDAEPPVVEPPAVEVPVAEPPAPEVPEIEPPAPEPPTSAAPAVEAPKEVSAEPAPPLDPSQVYAIVHMVVAKMSPRLPPQAIEGIAKPLADEINAELGASHPKNS